MAQVLIFADGGHTKSARLHFEEAAFEVEEATGEGHELTWKLLGLATMALVSAAGWAAILMVARHFLH
jgi:hypothetical protein